MAAGLTIVAATFGLIGLPVLPGVAYRLAMIRRETRHAGR